MFIQNTTLVLILQRYLILWKVFQSNVCTLILLRLSILLKVNFLLQIDSKKEGIMAALCVTRALFWRKKCRSACRYWGISLWAY